MDWWFPRIQNFVNMIRNYWITSDSHYGHKNICRGTTDWRMPDGSIPFEQTRDFPTLEMMNTAIVDNINAVVGPDDLLIHLGDWSFGGFENIYAFWSRLVCKNIHMVLGNHDKHIKNDKDGIRRIFTYVDSEIDEYIINGYQFHFSHYPLMSWKDMKSGAIHLHAHTHFIGDKRFGMGKMMDIGIDGHPELRPYNIMTEIIPLMNERPILSQYQTVTDHHMDGKRSRH